MVQLFPRMWWEENVFFGHVSDKDGLGIFHPTQGDLNLCFSVNPHFLAPLETLSLRLLNSCGFVLWSRKKILGLGSTLWRGCALRWAYESLPEFASVIISSRCSGCTLVVVGCRGFDRRTRTEDAECPPLLHAELLLILLGWADFPPQIFFRHITAAVSAVGSEDCFGCVLGGWVCLLAWGQCGEGRGNGLIRMRRDKKWWDWKGEAAALVMERW